MIKKAARYFGLEISRYNADRDANYLFNRWISNLQSKEPVKVVFDVGANHGQTVDRFRPEFPKATIYAFEPSSSVFSNLEARVINDPETKTFRLALGEYDGYATLHENASDLTSSLLPNSGHISQFAPPEMCVPKNQKTVPLKRIDTFCDNESIDHIDILKIDAQGYERQILEGAGSLLTPTIIRGLFIEVSFVDLYENQTWCGEVLELLRSLGYHFFGFTDIACDDTHGWKWADAMFIGNL